MDVSKSQIENTEDCSNHKAKAMFKKILVPVDFSETAQGALRYAVKAASQWESVEVHVVHVFAPEVPGDSVVIPNIETFLEAKEKALKDFVSEVNPPEGIKLTTELLIGFPADVIADVSSDYGLIIMGTTGAGGWLNRLLGSVSVAVAQRARCPVMLIPNDTLYTKMSHLVFACDIKAVDSPVMKLLKKISTETKTTLHFLHVRQEAEAPGAFDEAKIKLMEDIFKGGEPPFGFEIAEVSGDSISDAVGTYASEHHANAVGMVTRHRGLFEQLFHKSQTKDLAMHTKLPLVVFHTDD